MRYVLASLIVALGLTLTPDVPVLADHGDVSGPRCADIVDGSGVFDGSEVDFTIETTSASCPGVIYTLHVLDVSCPAEAGPCLDTEPTPVASQAVRGNRTTEVEFDVGASSSDGDDRVCVYATSSAGKHIFDRAPDKGCMIREAVPDLVFGSPFDCVGICDSCSDFVGGHILGGPGPDMYPVTFAVDTATASCPELTYTLEIIEVEPGTGEFIDVVASESVPGNGTTRIDFSLSMTPLEDQVLQVRGDSSGGGHIFDEGNFGCQFTLEGVVCALRFH